MTDYRPIDCADYSRYELAILRRQTLLLSWCDETLMVHLEVVEPKDLQTRAGEEFLIARRRDGRRLRVRLDRILAIRQPGGPASGA